MLTARSDNGRQVDVCLCFLTLVASRNRMLRFASREKAAHKIGRKKKDFHDGSHSVYLDGWMVEGRD